MDAVDCGCALSKCSRLEVSKGKDRSRIGGFYNPLSRTPQCARACCIGSWDRCRNASCLVGDLQQENVASLISHLSADDIAPIDWKPYDFISPSGIHLKPGIILLSAIYPVMRSANLLNCIAQIAIDANPDRAIGAFACGGEYGNRPVTRNSGDRFICRGSCKALRGDIAAPILADALRCRTGIARMDLRSIDRLNRALDDPRGPPDCRKASEREASPLFSSGDLRADTPAT